MKLMYPLKVWSRSGAPLFKWKKACFILICGFLLLFCSPLVAQTVNLSLKNVPLDQACKEIEKQTGYYFIYPKNMKDKNYQVNVDVKNAEVKVALGKVFENTPFTYEVTNMVVSINTHAKKAVVAGSGPGLDTMNITGTVYADMTALENASVSTSVTKKMALTKAGGQFTLNGVKRGEQLVVSFIGFESQRITLTDKRYYTAYLKAAKSDLDGVVVKAYGKTSKRMNTGDITHISGKDIEAQPILNPLQALEGRVPGLLVTTDYNDPTAPVRLQIRGRGTINNMMSTEPLIIVDGIPIMAVDKPGGVPEENTPISRGFNQSSFGGGMSSFYGINPRDIASIEVLKDAGSTAIYGSRGSNGVILITTKRGHAGNTSFRVNVGETMEMHYGFNDYLSESDYINLRKEAITFSGATPSKNYTDPGFAPDIFLWDTTKTPNWRKLAYGRMGKKHVVTAALDGGNAAASYRLSGNMTSTVNQTDEGGQRSGGVNYSLSSVSSNNKFKLDLTTAISSSLSDTKGGVPPVNAAPNQPLPYLDNGEPNYIGFRYTPFPYTYIFSSSNLKAINLMSGINLSYTILDGLSFTTGGGYNWSNGRYNSQQVPSKQIDITSGALTNSTGYAAWGSTINNTLNIEPRLTYSRVVYGGDLNLATGATYQYTQTTSNNQLGSGYTSKDMLGSIANAPHVTTGDYSGQYKYVGVYASVGYYYQHKYLADLTVRRDGSSRFGPGRQFGNFGSVAGAWILSEEPWAVKVMPKFVSSFKLRSSYGITGSDKIGDYQYLTQWSPLDPNGGQMQPYDGTSAVTQQIQANRAFHWPSTRQFEAAVEATFLDERLMLDVSWYRRNSADQLLAFGTAYATGFRDVTMNLPANVVNRGWEIMIGGKIIDGKDFKFSALFNTSIVKNILQSYPEIENSSYNHLYRVGGSLDDNYILHFTGIDPATGYPQFEDYDKDGKLTIETGAKVGTDDRRIKFNTQPRIYGGFNLMLQYKSLSFNANLDIRRQYDRQYNGTYMGNFNKNTTYGYYNARWKGPGDTQATLPKATTEAIPGISQMDLSDRNLTLNNEVRVQSMSLAYVFPASISRMLRMHNLGLNAAVNNAFLFRHYSALDLRQVSTRTMNLSLNCTF